MLNRYMPKGKIKHAKQVVKYLDFAPKYVKIAALFHDYLERGGDKKWLKANISKRSYKLVEMLTHDNDPLTHIKTVIDSIDNEKEKNFLILIKLADRKDNYKKRVRNKSLTPKYKRKTKELISYLKSQYSGDIDLF